MDISAPYYPRALGSLPLPGHSEEVAVSGRYTFVAGGAAGMRIIDISNPTAMREIGFSDTTGQALDIIVSGRYAYVAAANQGLRIIDIQNPAAPQGLPTRLDFPPGSVTVPTSIYLEPLQVESNTWLASTGHAFIVKASQGGQAFPKFSFAAPVTISIRYSDQDLRGVGDKGGLRFLRWYKDAWQGPKESCGSIDGYTQSSETNTISAAICHSGIYALFAPAYTVFFPVLH